MTMSEGALTRYFDLPRGKWRINASLPGFKVVAVAIEGLRHRLFPLRQVHGMPTWYYYYSNSVYIYPPPLHTWRLILTYALAGMSGAPAPRHVDADLA